MQSGGKSVFEKLCVFCEHLKWDYSAGGGGCETCGYGGEGNAEMDCHKGHWSWGGYDDMPEYREKILTAATCPDFKLVKLTGKLSSLFAANGEAKK